MVSGAGLQSRYILPLVYLFMLVALAPVAYKALPRWGHAQWATLVACLTVANSLALLYLELRYVTGINAAASPGALFEASTPDWWWSIWFSPGVNWVMGSIAFRRVSSQRSHWYRGGRPRTPPAHHLGAAKGQLIRRATPRAPTRARVVPFRRRPKPEQSRPFAFQRSLRRAMRIGDRLNTRTE